MHSAMLSLPAAPALAAGRVQLSRRSAPVRAHQVRVPSRAAPPALSTELSHGVAAPQARVQTRRTSTVVLAQHSAERGSAEERVRGACKADERTARASRLKPAATTPSASSSPAAAPPAELAGGGGGSGKGVPESATTSQPPLTHAPARYSRQRRLGRRRQRRQRRRRRAEQDAGCGGVRPALPGSCVPGPPTAPASPAALLLRARRRAAARVMARGECARPRSCSLVALPAWRSRGRGAFPGAPWTPSPPTLRAR